MAYIDNVTNILQIQPDGLPTFVRLSQNENGRNLYFQLAGNEIDIPANATITISGTKPDGTVYSGTGSISDNVILIPEMIQMTAVAGYWDAKVKIISGGNTIATGRIRFVIDADTVDPDSVPSDSELEGLVAEAQQYAETARTEAYGSPLTAQTVAGMTDHTRVYVYTGSESGYTAGHWYFWNGSAWTDGGIYNSTAVNTDTTLTLAGVAADAKATGDAIEAARVAIDDTLTNEGEAADAAAVGSEISGLKSDLNPLKSDVNALEYETGKMPETKNTADSSDLDLTDEEGNVILRLSGGHVKTKEFDSEHIKTSDLDNDEGFVTAEDMYYTVESKSSTGSADLYVTDEYGNVIVQIKDGHIKSKGFDSSRTDQNAVKTVNNTGPDSNGNVDVTAQLDPTELQNAVDDYLDEHPVVLSGGGIVSVDDFGAVGDGLTDDSSAVQNALNSADDVYFSSGKTYYLGSAVRVSKSIVLHGGTGTKITTKTKENAAANAGIIVEGTLKTTTTLTSDYLSSGDSTNDNAANRLTLADMSSVAVGDVIKIYSTETDQRYSYSRRYYYLGGVFKVVDIYEGHIYIDRSMPFDIALTNKLIVNVYNAPEVYAYNLNFESDLNSLTYKGNYNNLLDLNYCKDSVIRECTFSNMSSGLRISNCVNVRIDGVTIAKSRFLNTSDYGDGYGITVNSCNNTVIERVVAMCAQGCIDMGGDVPNFDTYIMKSHLASECRAIGIDMHDNSYNMTIEDCVLCGLSLFGTAIINRCQFIRSNRLTADPGGITYRGSHDPRWARLHVSNCIFNDGCNTWLTAQAAQDYIHPIDSVIDRVVFEHCRGGVLIYNPPSGAYILSNMINELVINDWQELDHFYHNPANNIKSLTVKDSSFVLGQYINKHSGTFSVENINETVIIDSQRLKYVRLFDGDIYGIKRLFPDNAAIEVSSDDENALFIACGENCMSTNSADYCIGNIAGSTGDIPTITKNPALASWLTSDGFGKLIYTPLDSNGHSIFPNYKIYSEKPSRLNFTFTAKNTGNTDGNSFRIYIVDIDCETGKIAYRGNGTSAKATADGLDFVHYRSIPKNHIVIPYIQTYDNVNGSETTFENICATLTTFDEPIPEYVDYIGHRLVGDGTLQTIDGINNILSSSDTFHISANIVYKII